MTEPSRIKCDGNHGGPPCDDPECWAREDPPGLSAAIDVAGAVDPWPLASVPGEASRERELLLYIDPGPFFDGLRAMFRAYGNRETIDEEDRDDTAAQFNRSCDDMCSTWVRLRAALKDAS